MTRVCSVPGCDGKFLARDVCNKHYLRLKVHGSLELPEHQIHHGTAWGYARDGCRCDPCREAERASKAAYRARHVDKARAASAAHEAKNRKKRTAQLAARRAANPRYAAAVKAWGQRNPEKRAMSKLRRRAAEANADTRSVTVKDWTRLLERWQHRCAYCDADKPLTREHIIPLSRGGRHAIGNLLPVCGSCNYSKGPKLLVEWRRAKNQ